MDPTPCSCPRIHKHLSWTWQWTQPSQDSLTWCYPITNFRRENATDSWAFLLKQSLFSFEIAGESNRQKILKKQHDRKKPLLGTHYRDIHLQSECWRRSSPSKYFFFFPSPSAVCCLRGILKIFKSFALWKKMSRTATLEYRTQAGTWLRRWEEAVPLLHFVAAFSDPL